MASLSLAKLGSRGYFRFVTSNVSGSSQLAAFIQIPNSQVNQFHTQTVNNVGAVDGTVKTKEAVTALVPVRNASSSTAGKAIKI